MVVPVVILGGFYLGAFTATEAGAVVAFYSFCAARFYYRNVSWREMIDIAYDSALLSAAVVFLLAVATVFQYLMGVSGAPLFLAEILKPLSGAHWLVLNGAAPMALLFGTVLQGLPAAVVLLPAVLSRGTKLGINPVHFD